MRDDEELIRSAELRVIASRLVVLASGRQARVRRSADAAETAAMAFQDSYLATIAAEELGIRRRRSKYLSADLFGEPAWNMLLDLFVCRVEQRKVGITSLSIASGAPSTTALRYISVLEERGLITRKPASHDQRVTYVELSEVGLKSIRSALADYALVRDTKPMSGQHQATIFDWPSSDVARETDR